MPIIVAHNKSHIELALAAAKAAGISVTFQSPEHGLRAHGLLMLIAMFDGTDWILNCADEAALAVEAMRLGVKKICIHNAHPAKAKLQDIAQQMNAQLITAPYETLDLAKSLSPGQDCASYIRKSA